MPLIDSFLFTAEITVLFVANRRCLENDDLENNDLENDDLENHDL